MLVCSATKSVCCMTSRKLWRELVLLTLCLVFEEAVDLGNGSVEGHDGKAMIGSVENQILAHDRKANETEITTGFGLRRANLEVGQSRTRVSILVVNGGSLSRKKQSSPRSSWD